MTLLIIEYARKRHMPLFILNIVLVLYAVYGYLVPGMFYHAGSDLDPRDHAPAAWRWRPASSRACRRSRSP